MLRFNTDGMVRQSFPFPDPIMDYILKNVQPQHLVKLYPTCKFFYDKFRMNIIRHLEIVDDGEDEVFDPVKTILCVSNPAISKLVDFWITDSFTTPLPYYMLEIPEFSNCNIKKLVLTDSIYWEDYEILTRAGTVEELKMLQPCVYHDHDGIHLPYTVDEIVAQIPNANSIELSKGHFTATSCSSLVSLNHRAKLSNFILHDIITIRFFNLQLFIDFILKNADPDCNVRVGYKSFTTYDPFIQAFNNIFSALGIHESDAIKSALEKKKIADQMS